MTLQPFVSEDEQLVDVGGGVRLCTVSSGPADGEPLVLIAGLGRQLVTWPTELVDGLAERGFRVVRFDNRDAGRSTHLDIAPPRPDQIVRRRFHPAQYDLSAMAADTAGLIDGLGLKSAHLVGVSMGGMIAQTVAARHGGKVRTLTSIMSNAGQRATGQPARSTWVRMAAPPARSRERVIGQVVSLFRHIGSHGFPFDEAELRAVTGEEFDRGHDPGGTSRQLAAIMKSGDRTAEIGGITAPTLVIHGDRDRMVHPSGGRATADAIRGARHETIIGMGHDLPAGVRVRLVELIATHTAATPAPTAPAAS